MIETSGLGLQVQVGTGMYRDWGAKIGKTTGKTHLRFSSAEICSLNECNESSSFRLCEHLWHVNETKTLSSDMSD